MNTLFQGSSLDIYVHWLILALGIGILLSGMAIFVSCRSVAGVLHLAGAPHTRGARAYQAFSRFHSYYWGAFWILKSLFWPISMQALICMRCKK